MFVIFFARYKVDRFVLNMPEFLLILIYVASFCGVNFWD